jgi:TolA-binding protein
VTEQQNLYKDLLSRQDLAPADVDTQAQNTARLEETIREVKRERDTAIRAAEEAEDRIETMKGEVVRKHLARVEPLEKENAYLTDKIERLEAIIAAGDRIARAAATMGEKRNINTLTEEVEEDDEEDAVTSSSAQVAQVNGTGAPNDVVGTVS